MLRIIQISVLLYSNKRLATKLAYQVQDNLGIFHICYL